MERVGAVPDRSWTQRPIWLLEAAARSRPIVASVRRTNRLVVVHEGWKFGGFGGEIAASVTEAAFDWLDAPVARVGAPDVPMPFNDRLERSVIPSAERIVAATKGLFGDT